MSGVGTRVNVDSLARALEVQRLAGTIRACGRQGANKWYVLTSDGQEYVMTGMAQIHALIIGLRSAQLALQAHDHEHKEKG